jgi:excisionase family DNA binding protein
MNLLTKQETAQKLRITVDGLNKKLARREIPFYKTGRRVLFSEKDIQAYLESRKIA